MKYRMKPVVIEARQLTGDYDADLAVMAWCGGEFPHEDFQDEMLFYLPTLEGEMVANTGDWIIQGAAGEFYPCKPGIFEATYEVVE